MNIIMVGACANFRETETTVFSVMKNNRNVNWYFLCADSICCNPETGLYGYFGLYQEQKDKLGKIVQYFDAKSHIKYVDISPLYNEYFSAAKDCHYEQFIWLADKALPHVQDAIYLECNTICVKNLELIYKQCLEKQDAYYAYWVPQKNEIVNGVMFFNLDICREQGLFDKIRRNCFRFGEPKLKDVQMPSFLPHEYCYCDKIARMDGYDIAIYCFALELQPSLLENGEDYFYNQFPFLSWIRDGLDLIDKIKW